MMMSIRSVGRKTVGYLASAAILSVLIIVASTLYLGLPILTSTSSVSSGSASTSIAGPQSLLVIQLTDPPQVPLGTKSLNLTESSLSLVVGEPAGNGKVNPTSVSVTPTGGATTLNLLKLQNVSQTIASANLPNGTVIYSVTFAVSSISINVNGTVSPVTLATGGNSFSVTIAQPTSLHGENVALLQLNPIVVGTPSGYQLIPSAVGVIKHSEGQGQEQVGFQHMMSHNDSSVIQSAKGNLTGNLLTLAVSGNTTSVTVQVKNSGGASVTLDAIGLHGNFTTTGNGCSMMGMPNRGQGSDHHVCEVQMHMNEVVFAPVVPTTSTTTSSHSTTTSSTATSTACTSGQMNLVNGDGGDQGHEGGFVLQAGQCVNFAFSGKITFGESSNVLLPSTASGQKYEVHVIGSEGANLQLNCVLPLGASSCTADTQGWFNFGDFMKPSR
jgi:hypothetical protein